MYNIYYRIFFFIFFFSFWKLLLKYYESYKVSLENNLPSNEHTRSISSNTTLFTNTQVTSLIHKSLFTKRVDYILSSQDTSYPIKLILKLLDILSSNDSWKRNYTISLNTFIESNDIKQFFLYQFLRIINKNLH